MSRPRFLPVLCLWMVTASGWAARDADQAVARLMRSQNAAVRHVQFLHRATVDTELDLVVALAVTNNWQPAPAEGGSWDDKTKLGVFLQRRNEPGMIYQITLQSGYPDGECYARVERATPTDVVVSCTPEKGRAGPNRKFVYDIRAKALVKDVSYARFAMNRFFPSATKTVLVGSDYRSLVALEYQPGQEQPFRVLQGAQAATWTVRVPVVASEAGTGSNYHRDIYIRPKDQRPAPFGPGGRFTLSPDEPPVVVERIGGAVKRHPLPQSTFEQFNLARPSPERNSNRRDGTTIREMIAQWQIADGTLWVAKGFYDSEGFTGVGGFGYFDPQAREYHLYAPEELRDWSVSAMLVEPNAVWLGLVHSGEWGGVGGGLLRFDRATQKVTRLKLRETISEIARVGDRLALATDFGVALLDGEHLRRYFVDETTDGRLRVAEALPGTGAGFK